MSNGLLSAAKIGGAAKMVLAGERFHDERGEDYGVWSRIDCADFVFAWFDERTDDWWSDILYATQSNKLVMFCDASSEIITARFTCRRYSRAIFLHDCRSRDEALALAAAFAFHDPKANAKGALWSARLLGILERCESPIEARLAVHMYGRISEGTSCDLRNQVQDGAYRLDFTIDNSGWAKDDPDVEKLEPIKLCIECDGHNFHELTKEQAKRDKSRDRALVAAGWTVLRFTGSEIWNNPEKCVDEIMGIIDGKGGCF